MKRSWQMGDWDYQDDDPTYQCQLKMAINISREYSMHWRKKCQICECYCQSHQYQYQDEDQAYQEELEKAKEESNKTKFEEDYKVAEHLFERLEVSPGIKKRKVANKSGDQVAVFELNHRRVF